MLTDGTYLAIEVISIHCCSHKLLIRDQSLEFRNENDCRALSHSHVHMLQISTAGTRFAVHTQVYTQ